MQLITDKDVTGDWTVQEWHLEKEISSVVIRTENQLSEQDASLNFFAASSARSFIAA